MTVACTTRAFGERRRDRPVAERAERHPPAVDRPALVEHREVGGEAATGRRRVDPDAEAPVRPERRGRVDPHVLGGEVVDAAGVGHHRLGRPEPPGPGDAGLRPGVALGVADLRQCIGAEVGGDDVGEAVLVVEHLLEPGHRVAVRQPVAGADLAEHPAHRRDAVPAGDEAPERPVAVVLEPVGVEEVQRAAGSLHLTVRQVGAVVVDVVGVLLLHPGGGRLQQPEVLLDVVGVLDGVEELVGGGDPQAS